MNEPVEEFVGENEEVENQQCADCSYGHYPDFCAEPDKKNFEWGVKEGSYITGFVSAINSLGFSESTLSSIIIDKIHLEYEKEVARMQLESAERIATIYSKQPMQIIERE